MSNTTDIKPDVQEVNSSSTTQSNSGDVTVDDRREETSSNTKSLVTEPSKSATAPLSPKQVPLEMVGIVFTLESGNPSDALGILQSNKVELTHIESRQSTKYPGRYDFIALCNSKSSEFETAMEKLKDAVMSLEILKDGTDDEAPKYPKHVSDLDKFSNKILKLGKELEKADHPGYNDEAYKRRRQYFADLATDYKHGQPIPHVKYTEDERNTWKHIYNNLESVYPTHACQEFNYWFQLLKEKCNFGPDEIPQLEDMSNFLRDRTGYTLRPVAGLLSIGKFLAGMAFRVFHATQYVRHGSKPDYTPEPDVCHEVIGHVPMLADPEFAQFTQDLGLASLGAPQDFVVKLGRLYFHTVEFGLCRQNGEIKACGAGLLSSIGELKHCLTDKAERRDFDPTKVVEQKPVLTEFQPAYYISDSFQSAQNVLKAYVSKNPRKFNIRYNPYTHSMEVLNTKKGVMDLMKTLKGDAEFIEDTLANVRSFLE